MVLMPIWPKISFNKPPLKTDLVDFALLMDALGNPHLKIPATIHIAGTNGKGSTVAYLHSIFRTAGYKVHTYTSPHLKRFNERILLNSEEISDELLAILGDEVRIALKDTDLEEKLTFFDKITAIAMLAFSSYPADILILETGLGGRLDPTNIVPNPLATIITPISFDHMNVLGHSILAIASAKAGIIKTGSACIISYQYPEVYDFLFSVCAAKSVDVLAYEYDFVAKKLTNDHFAFQNKNSYIELMPSGLLGDHQVINAVVSIATILQNKIAENYFINDTCIRDGIKNVCWPGRLQNISNHQIQNWYNSFNNQNTASINNLAIWVDGAHNEGSAQVLSNWIKKKFPNNLRDDSELHIIFGMTKGRDISSFIQHLVDLADNIYPVSIKNEPASYTSVEMYNYITHNSSLAMIEKFHYCEDLSDAICTIINKQNYKFQNIIITGSLFLVGEALKLFKS